jgi:hypothetical protein
MLINLRTEAILPFFLATELAQIVGVHGHHHQIWSLMCTMWAPSDLVFDVHYVGTISMSLFVRLGMLSSSP